MCIVDLFTILFFIEFSELVTAQNVGEHKHKQNVGEHKRKQFIIFERMHKHIFTLVKAMMRDFGLSLIYYRRVSIYRSGNGFILRFLWSPLPNASVDSSKYEYDNWKSQTCGDCDDDCHGNSVYRRSTKTNRSRPGNIKFQKHYLKKHNLYLGIFFLLKKKSKDTVKVHRSWMYTNILCNSWHRVTNFLLCCISFP